MSQRRNNRSAAPVEEEIDSNIEDAIKECVRYIICREGSKIPIKRAEIQKFLATSHQVPTNKINLVVAEANKLLKKVYGYKLVQVEAKGGIQYIVVLHSECQSLESSATDPEHNRLLIAALTHIFMSGGSVNEDDMWKFLDEAGLLEANDNTGHKAFISSFTKQLYLSYSKSGEGDLTRYLFEWGQRAIEEVPKMFLLQKMADAFNKSPNHWYEQHKDAIEENAPVPVE